MILLPAFVISALLSILPTAVAGTEYDSGPIAPGSVLGCKRGIPHYRVVGGALPPGLELRGAGFLAGIPLHAGQYEMLLQIDNGCGKTPLVARVAVQGRAILSPFDSEIELSEDKPEAVLRVSSDHQGMPYSITTSEPWLTAKPLLGRTPRAGEALAADLVTLTVDWNALQPPRTGEESAESTPKRQAILYLTCFRCQGATVTVRLPE